jgi:hypothetical protein
MDTAKRSVDLLHARYNASEIDQIYDEAAPAYRKTTTPEQARKMLENMKSQLGDVRSWSTTSFVAKAQASGTVARLVTKAGFEKGEATEFFVWAIDGKAAQLVSYRVSIPVRSE